MTAKLETRENGIYFEENIAVVGGKSFPIVKKGLAQAEQVKELLKWLSKHLRNIAAEVSDEDGNINIKTVFDLVDIVAAAVSTEALIDLFSVAVGCSKPTAEKEFDLAILVDLVEYIYTEQPTYKRVISRFFSTEDSEKSTE